MTKVTANISIDFNINETIKSDFRLKRLKGESEITKEEAMGTMVEERHELEKHLIKKGMTFKELIQFLNQKSKS